MATWLRVKRKGAEMLQLDTSKIVSYEVNFWDPTYALLAHADGGYFVLSEGTFDECHYLLNSINNATTNTIILDLQ